MNTQVKKFDLTLQDSPQKAVLENSEDSYHNVQETIYEEPDEEWIV